MKKNRKNNFKRFLLILLSVIIIFNVATPQVILPKAEAGSFGGYVMYPLACLTGGIAWAFQQVLNLAKFVVEALMNSRWRGL